MEEEVGVGRWGGSAKSKWDADEEWKEKVFPETTTTKTFVPKFIRIQIFLDHVLN